MKYEVESTGECTGIVNVVISEESIDEGMNTSLSKIRKTVKLRGFRAGRVPIGLVRKMYGQNVRKEVVNDLIHEGLGKIPGKYPNIIYAGTPSIKSGLIDKGPVTFELPIEMKPQIEPTNFLNREVTIPLPEVSEQEIATQLAQLQKRCSTWSPANREIVQENDGVLIDYKFDNNDEEASLNDHFVDLNENNPLGFEKSLVGLSMGEHTINVVFNETSVYSDLHGKDVEVYIKLKEIKELSIPELDDDFAQEHGEADSLDELKESIQTVLMEQKSVNRRDTVKGYLVDDLLAEHIFSLPPNYVNQRIESQLEQYGMSKGDETLTEEEEARKAEFANMLRPNVEIKLRQNLFLEAVAKNVALEVTELDVDSKLEEISKSQRMAVSQLRRQFEQNNGMEAFKESILIEKTLEHLVDTATVVEVSGEEFQKIQKEKTTAIMAAEAELEVSKPLEEKIPEAPEEEVSENISEPESADSDKNETEETDIG